MERGRGGGGGGGKGEEGVSEREGGMETQNLLLQLVHKLLVGIHTHTSVSPYVYVSPEYCGVLFHVYL